jgi:hypothetical protein
MSTHRICRNLMKMTDTVFPRIYRELDSVQSVIEELCVVAAFRHYIILKSMGKSSSDEPMDSRVTAESENYG